MSNVYSMDGKKKVIFTEEPEIELTYKEIMQIIIKHSTEEGCKQIFSDGGINLCPSDIFGTEKINKQEEEDICNYNSIGCVKCWTNAVNKLKKESKNV